MDFDLASVDYILQTTRSVRKRLDLTRPVEREIVLECLDVALQAPTGGNSQSWHWLILTDPDKKAQIADYYRQAWRTYIKTGGAPSRGEGEPGQRRKVFASANYLAKHLADVPMMIFACIDGRPEGSFNSAGIYGSIIPAAWSLMLALRARGIGSAWTTLHLAYESECNAILGIPDHVTTAVMLPVAYFTGETFKPAKRLPAHELTYWDHWGQKG